MRVFARVCAGRCSSRETTPGCRLVRDELLFVVVTDRQLFYLKWRVWSFVFMANSTTISKIHTFLIPETWLRLQELTHLDPYWSGRELAWLNTLIVGNNYWMRCLLVLVFFYNTLCILWAKSWLLEDLLIWLHQSLSKSSPPEQLAVWPTWSPSLWTQPKCDCRWAASPQVYELSPQHIIAT